MLKKFRPCAGAVVFNKYGCILLCNRNDTRSDAWQFPQGGIESNETALEAAKRELFEETSIVSVDPVYTDNESKKYEFTEDIKSNFRKRGIFNDGQDICFTLFYFYGEDNEINLNTKQPEFREYKWSNFEFAVENIVDFKKDVYSATAQKFEPIIRQYLEKLS